MLSEQHTALYSLHHAVKVLFADMCRLKYIIHCVCVDATVYVGGLDEKVSEPLLWELFLQAGPVVNTHMPKDRVTGQHQGEFNTDTHSKILSAGVSLFITPYVSHCLCSSLLFSYET